MHQQMMNRISRTRLCCRCISVLGILPGFIIIAVGASMGMPAVILGGIGLLAIGTIGVLFERMT